MLTRTFPNADAFSDNDLDGFRTHADSMEATWGQSRCAKRVAVTISKAEQVLELGAHGGQELR